MENETKVGMNRTGMQMAPIQGQSQVEYAMSQPAHPPMGDAGDIAAVRALYIQESLRVGSVPIPATGRGIAETALGKLKGMNPEVLFDKLGERASYERSGVRLYQAMIAKVQATKHAEQAPLLADLQHICEEELQHFHLLAAMIQDLGGDPTAQTPCAEISAVASMGMIQVLTDPRTTIAQCLQALLSVEMTDNACWELLIELAEQGGHDDMTARFQRALASEQEHETMIRQWLRKVTMQEAT